MKALRRIAIFLLGLVFLSSGLLKIMDPVGTGLIVHEYLHFFHLGFLDGISKGIGILLSLAEGVLGVALLCGVRPRLTALATWILTGFFTLITLILWIFKPEMDCGCFGEAIHLTHLQSLLKNLVLLALTALAFLPKPADSPVPTRKKVAFWIAAASLFFSLWYNDRHLPLLDFTDFAPGAELAASLDNDYQAEDGLVPTLIYEKGGQRGSFSPEYLPDTSWTFVGVDTLERNGLPRPSGAPALSFTDADGTYRDEDAVLGKVVLFSVYKPEKADWKRLAGQYETARNAGATTMVLVAGTPEDMDELGVPPELSIFYADYKTLITLNRANGGGCYICKGEIVTKWAPCDAPKAGHMEGLLARNSVDASTAFVTHRRILAQGFCLYLAALLILL